MKKLTCRDLGGPCGEEITGNSFDEIGNNCRAHVEEKMKGGDKAHQEEVAKMMNASPDEQKAMMAEYEKRFNKAPSI